MTNIFFICVILHQVCGFVELKSNSPNTSMKVGELLNSEGIYNIHRQQGPPVRYAQFPRTFIDHHIGLAAVPQPYQIKPVVQKPNPDTEYVPNNFGPLDSALEREHHFLTRPQSVVATPIGPHYMPHLINSGPFPVNDNHHMDSPLYNSFLDSFRPGITVIAKNIFIHNDNRTFLASSNPFGRTLYNGFLKPASNPFKPEFLDKKLLLLKRLSSSNTPSGMTLVKEIDVRPLATFEATPVVNQHHTTHLTGMQTFIPPAGSRGEISHRPVMEILKPGSSFISPLFSGPAISDNSIALEHAVAPEETHGLSEFHPLLKPFEQKGNENKASKDSGDSSVVTVTGLGNMTSVTEYSHKETGDVRAAEHGEGSRI